MTSANVFIAEIEHDSFQTEARERRKGSLEAPRQAEYAADLFEADDGTASEVRRRFAKRAGEASGNDRPAGCKRRHRQTTCFDFVVIGIRIQPGFSASAGEIEDLNTATVNAVQCYFGLAMHDGVDDTAEVRQVHANHTLRGVEQNLR